MSKWAKLVKRLDRFFMLTALLCSAPVFLLLLMQFMEVASRVENASQTSFNAVSWVMFTTYFYWFIRAMWYMVKSYSPNKR